MGTKVPTQEVTNTKHCTNEPQYVMKATARVKDEYYL